MCYCVPFVSHATLFHYKTMDINPDINDIPRLIIGLLCLPVITSTHNVTANEI